MSDDAFGAYVQREVVDKLNDSDHSQFEAELQAHRPPRNADIDAIPNRLIL